jgi:hypothetical protein
MSHDSRLSTSDESGVTSRATTNALRATLAFADDGYCEQLNNSREKRKELVAEWLGQPTPQFEGPITTLSSRAERVIEVSAPVSNCGSRVTLRVCGADGLKRARKLVGRMCRPCVTEQCIQLRLTSLRYEQAHSVRSRMPDGILLELVGDGQLPLEKLLIQRHTRRYIGADSSTHLIPADRTELTLHS